jgi:hypothetical protein
MAEIDLEVTTARVAIRHMLAERPRPTQTRIAAATGLTQGGVAKINRCGFRRMSAGVRRVVEYSRMSEAQRRAAEARAARIADRIGSGARRIAARDPALGEVIAEFIERLAATSAP